MHSFPALFDSIVDPQPHRWLLALAALVTVTACAPSSAVRRTAYVPAARAPARVGRPLASFEHRLSAQLNPIRMQGWGDPLTPLWDLDQLLALDADMYDPGLYIPQLQLGLTYYVGLGRYFELGLQASYAHRSWGRQNVAGVLDLPSDSHLIGGGPGMRFNLPFRDIGLTVSLSMELNVTQGEQAVFLCRLDPCEPTLGVSGPALYELHHVDTYRWFDPSLFLHVGFDLSEYVHIFGLAGGHRGLKNSGFDLLETLQDSTLESYLIGVVGVGVEARYQHLVGNLSFVYPLEDELKIDFGVSMILQLGVSFGGAAAGD